MIKIFIDCEFSDLVPDNKLISIALMAENGEFFYAELNDTYERCECSDFVMNFVLPFLKGGEYVMSENECALKMTNWIEERGECIIACDNMSWDLPHLHRLINKTGLWPENLKKDEVFKFIIMDEITEKIVIEYDLDVHNALDDARVMVVANNMGEAWEY